MVCITDDQVADAKVFPFKAGLLQDFLSFFRLEDFLRAVDPASAKSQRMSGKKHLSDGKASVFDALVPVLRCQHGNHDRRTVEGIETFLPSASLAVQIRKLITRFFVRDWCGFVNTDK